MPPLPAFTAHGGALAAARQAFPHARQPWLDLSTGINPVAYPMPDLAPDVWTRLPCPSDLFALEASALHCYGAARNVEAVAAAGSQAIIQWLPAIAPGLEVRVLGPTYDEYARSFERAGFRVRHVRTLDALMGGDAAVVVNPNNPDGRFVDAAELVSLARTVGILIVDETFADLEERSNTVAGQAPNIIALRSFGKTYGLPGLRLGFALAEAQFAAAIRDRLGPWPVNGGAVAVGIIALADRRWLSDTRARCASDAAALRKLLQSNGLIVQGGTSLFQLASHPEANRLFHHLAAGGILIRPFADRPNELRFGLPGQAKGWTRLAERLSAATSTASLGSPCSSDQKAS